MLIWTPSGSGRPLIGAHRGNSAFEPENTPTAARSAVRAGASWVEFDVRPSADGLVVHHDPVTSAGQPVAATPTEALTGVPSFGEFIEACGSMGLDIEMKTDDIGRSIGAFVELVAHEIDTHLAVGARSANEIGNQIMVTSFDQAALDAFHSHRPEIATGVLFDEETGAWAIDRALTNGHAAIVPWYPIVTPELVDQAHAAGLAVLTWTVNDAETANRVADAGVDMVIGDDPALLIATLGAGR